MRYEQVFDKAFVSEQISESIVVTRRSLVDELMAQIWGKWVPGASIEFEHNFISTYDFRDSTVESVVAEFTEKGWSISVERLGRSNFRFLVA